ncbi:MAG: hypothetical protein J5965_25480, partial [Aeriscardovia sp.]|nr:hypothetical protein [Aeriscardovia sp.]
VVSLHIESDMLGFCEVFLQPLQRCPSVLSSFVNRQFALKSSPDLSTPEHPRVSLLASTYPSYPHVYHK